MDFDVIPFEDLKGNWKKLGSGSFGNVYKGTYLGIDVAIKEVLPSTEYDVAKYFEREWRLMKEARHPNVVLYLGLSRAPPPDNRIFIISEFIENGNLRIYIFNKTNPFPWRLRVSFATDIARALAYLHARRCIHRDLKGENLLITPNGRLKITDFGFARIAARNAEEVKRLTFCGTDSYMSPEIMLGEEFDLPTDVFSLGVILCEILARTLADDVTFKRTPPSFDIDKREVRQMASPGAPADFIQLAIDCCALRPADRPTTPQILARLRAIEVEVLSRPSEVDDLHVGSVKFFTQKRPGAPPRMPSFSAIRDKDEKKTNDSQPEGSDDEELADAVNSLKSVTLEGDDDDDSTAWSRMTAKEGHFASVKDSLQLRNGHARVNGDGVSDLGQPLLADSEDGSTLTYSDYSTSVVKGAGQVPPSLSSIMTVRPIKQASEEEIAIPSGPTDSMLSIDSFHTARSSSILNAPSIAAATEGGSTIYSEAPSVMLHRFTLIKPGASGKKIPTGVSQGITSSASHGPSEAGWSPFDFFFSSGLVAKCDLCHKRLGWKPVLECDDCGLRTHIKCGELAPRDCGLRGRNAPLTTGAVPLNKVKGKSR